MDIKSVISLIIGFISLIITIITLIKTENSKHQLRVQISRLVTESHSVRFEIMKLINSLSPADLEKVQGRLDSFNHSIFIGLLSLDEKAAFAWLKYNKKNENGYVDWNYYRSLFFFKFKKAEK